MGWGGREALKGGHMCIPMTDSHCCTAKTTQNCKAIILQVKIQKKKRRGSELLTIVGMIEGI